MKPSYRDFLLNLSAVTALAGAGAYFVSQKYTRGGFGLATYLCIYFFLLTALSHYLIVQSETGNDRIKHSRFISRFTIVTAAKFFLSIIILLGYVLLNPETAVDFIILFALYYLVFTAFEAGSLFLYFKRKK